MVEVSKPVVRSMSVGGGRRHTRVVPLRDSSSIVVEVPGLCSLVVQRLPAVVLLVGRRLVRERGRILVGQRRFGS